MNVRLFTTPRGGENAINFSCRGVEVFSFSTAHHRPLIRRVALVRLIFQLIAERILRRRHTLLEIAYDPIGIWVSRRAGRRAKLTIHHFHEILFDDVSSPYERFARLSMPKADLITVADPGRAKLMRNVHPKPKRVETVRNYPLKAQAEVAPQEKHSGFKVVYFGAFGDSQCLDTIVTSMLWWPKDVSLHLYGKPDDEYRKKLLQIADRVGVNDRIFFEGWVEASDLIGVVSKYHIGFSMLKPLNDNWRFSAGASNKRFHLIGAGIPQITDNGEGVMELIELNQVGICVSPNDPRKIAEAVSEYYLDRRRITEDGRRARELIQSSLNQEIEFDKVIRIAEQADEKC